MKYKVITISAWDPVAGEEVLDQSIKVVGLETSACDPAITFCYFRAKRSLRLSCAGNNDGRNLRSAYPNGNARDNANDNNGFRLARAQFATGWCNRTRQHPVMMALPLCKPQGDRSESHRHQSAPVNRVCRL